jgi:hypothetical protein
MMGKTLFFNQQRESGGKMDFQIPDNPVVVKNVKGHSESKNRKLKVLKHEYECHMQVYPGFYRVDESFDSVHNNAYRKWVRKKDELSERLRVFQAIDRDINLTEVFFNPGLQPSRLTNKKNLSMETYYNSYMESLNYMSTLKNRSLEWRNERSRAANLRAKVILQAELEDLPLPEPLPKLPEVIRK